MENILLVRVRLWNNVMRCMFTIFHDKCYSCPKLQRLSLRLPIRLGQTMGDTNGAPGHYRIMAGVWSTNLSSRWRHQMETFSALLADCAGNSPVTGEFPSQRPVTGNFDVFFDLCLNKRLSKQSWGWWFETPSHPLWRHNNTIISLSLRSIIECS